MHDSFDVCVCQTKTKSKQSENNPDVKPVLEKMRALGKELKAEGKSEAWAHRGFLGLRRGTEECQLRYVEAPAAYLSLVRHPGSRSFHSR